MSFAPVRTEMPEGWNEHYLKPLHEREDLYPHLIEQGFEYGTDCTLFAVCSEHDEHTDCFACVYARIPEADGHVYTVTMDGVGKPVTACRICGAPAFVEG